MVLALSVSLLQLASQFSFQTLVLKGAKFIAIYDVRNERRRTIKSDVEKQSGNNNYQICNDHYRRPLAHASAHHRGVT
jgi:hypothetical protein